MNKKTKQNITGFILSLILIGYGYICGYIIGKATGEVKATERFNDLLEDYKYYSSSRDH